MKDIHDIKPLLAVGIDWRWLPWLLAVLAAAAVMMLLWWWWRRRRRPPQTIVTQPLPSPEAEALAALATLAADGSGDGKRFYFDLTAILKRYLERRYAIPAAEMTVEELLPQVARLPLQSELAEPLKALCRLAEPIKFADAAADPSRMAADLLFIRDLVQRTTPETVDDSGRMET
ncbi:MAG: DUF4381 family protein [Desulfatitalea sp.]|nr:DUF4381 family protein [Desulfatitalea sp.]